ncbi:MAG: carbon storage regulator CsrA [Deltaproteobacteria bacterium]|nr:carbon storage regulator CsrA [Deltaproteobacteria bacterium]
MLVLTRKPGEGIAIGDDIKIVVMQVKGKQVRLGIRAAPTTTVHREEVWQKIHEENQIAAQVQSEQLEQVRAHFPLSSWSSSDKDQAPLKTRTRTS